MNMNQKFKKIFYQVILFLSLVFIGYQISGNYDYSINDDGFLFSISLAVLISYIWHKIDTKFFK